APERENREWRIENRTPGILRFFLLFLLFASCFSRLGQLGEALWPERHLMCGIAGYFGREDIPEERVRASLALMGRRGPDHAGARRWKNPSDRNVLLLHSRLSIIDLDPRSNQ